MSSKKEISLVKSFLQFSAGPWLSALISFATTPITTYLIIPEEFGKASMYTVAFSLILNIVLLGTDQSFVRMFYEHREDKRSILLWNCLIPSLLLSFIISAILLILRKEVSVILFDNPDFLLPVILLSLTIIFAVFERFGTLVLRMKKRGIAFSSLRVVSVASRAGGIIFYALLIDRSFYAVIFGTLLAHFSVFIISMLLEFKFWRNGLKLSKSKIKSTILYGLPFVPTFVITWLLNSMDKLALRSFSTFQEIGLYTAANKIVAVLLLIQTGFSMFWTPTAYENFEKNPDNTQLYSKATRVLASIMFFISILLIGFKDVIILILDKAYLPAADIMPFLIFHPIMYTISEITVVGINFMKKTQWHMLIATSAAGVNFIGNMIFVPIYGAKGAALSTGVSFIVFFYVRTLISRKLYKVDYSLIRFTLGTCTLIIIALINTFIDYTVIEVGSAATGLIIISLLYRKEIIYTFRLLKKILIALKNRKMNKQSSK